MIAYFTKFLRYFLISFVMVYSISITNVYSQVPDIIIDGTPTLVGDLSMFPYWLSTGQTIETGTKVNSGLLNKSDQVTFIYFSWRQ